MRISSRQKKWIIIVAAAISLVFGAGLIFALSKRDGMLRDAVARVQQKLKNDYQIDFKVDNYRFSGLKSVAFENVSLVPQNRDTLARIGQLEVSVRIFPLLFGEVKIGNLELEQGRVTFVKGDTLSNYDFLFRKKVQDTVAIEEPSKRNFADWTEKIARQVFAQVPQNLRIQDLEISYADSSIHQKVCIPEARIDNGDFKTSLFLNEQDAEWLLEGHVDGDKQQLRVEVSSKEKGTNLPFLPSKYGLNVSFDKIVLDLHHIKRVQSDLLNIDGAMEYHNLVINHRRLSTEDIVIPEITAQGGFDVSADFVALSPGSTIKAKEFAVQPHLKYNLSAPRKVELSIHTGHFPAQQFFDAIPKGFFQTLDGLQVKGDIRYDLDFAVELDNPDNITFSSSIDDQQLEIIKWGNARIDSLNNPFVYEAYDDTTLLRHIVVGPSNPHFIPLEDIPYVLKTTVRNTEDPFFYRHNGFEEEAFKLSIVTNLKEKQFKRGASTISMQLVKNLFLHRKKTMDRKLEEILLVWLMERSGQVSKDRLFEIYLNVIEWGRNVYGISEAAQYYFGKPAQALNLGESLFLSSIIPRPKTGLSSFDHTGHLKPWVLRHFDTYGGIMRKVGDLDQVEVPENYGFYNVLLQPKLRPKAPIMRDTSQVDDMHPDHERFMREVEHEEGVRQSILEKLFGKEKDE